MASGLKPIDDILTNAIIELHTKAGFTANDISKCITNLNVKDIKDFLEKKGFNPNKPPVELNSMAGREIINASPKDVTLEQLVENEKERFFRYSEIERQALHIMDSLLNYYSEQPIGDINVDRFKAHLADTFLKNTQNARNELLTKYENNQKKNNVIDNKIEIKFI